jgi:anti-anti-sigma factor
MVFRKKKQGMLANGGWFKADVREHDIFVRLSGRLDHTLRNQLRIKLAALLKRRIQGAIVLQLSDVHFIEAVAAATVAEFLRQADQQGVSVEIWNASPEVKRAFAGLGIEALLNR